MTPAETFAKSRIEAENLIRQYAPARLQDAVIERLLPAIALTATRSDDRDIAVGASKFGGAPDVPEGFDWPMWDERPLGFVAQINLDEIAPFDVQNLLPSSGLLSFFYCFDYMDDGDQWPDGELGQEDSWRVLYFDSNLTRAEVPSETQSEYGISAAKIIPRAWWNVPKDPFYFTEEQGSDSYEEDVEKWWDMNEAFEKDATHLMFGYPREVQNDAREDAARILERGDLNDWHLLLQVDTDSEINWMLGDAGAMFYLMHRDDLAKREFDKCWLISQSH